MAKVSTPRRRKIRQVPILVVESNADHWLLIRATLKQCFPEVEPLWMNNAFQTIEYLKTTAVDVDKLPKLIFLDLYLPRQEDGLSVLGFIKNHSFYLKPPVIILSSSQDKEDITAAYSFSVASYIIKPVSYNNWLKCFYTFRRYWWETVTLLSQPQ